jgi:exodeoxyribonuclease X
MLLRVIDIETDGLKPEAARVVEIAVVDLVREEADGVWRLGQMWSSLVDNGRPIPPQTSAVHHITTAMVRGAPRLGELWDPVHFRPQGAAWSDPDYIVAHHAEFERGFLGGDWLCTYKAAVVRWPEAPEHKLQTLRYWLGLEFAEDPGPPHRALGDAYVTAAIAQRILSHGDDDVLAWWRETSAGPVLLPRFHFGKYRGKPYTDAEVPDSYLEWAVRDYDNENVKHTAAIELRRRHGRTDQAASSSAGRQELWRFG